MAHKMIDLTKGDKTFIVSTRVVRDGVAYMGPDVKVNARNAEHAKDVTRDNGHIPNPYFPPKEVKDYVKRNKSYKSFIA